MYKIKKYIIVFRKNICTKHKMYYIGVVGIIILCIHNMYSTYYYYCTVYILCIGKKLIQCTN